jgi:ABC-type multidrug transport system fused ATPase/permease subunit
MNSLIMVLLVGTTLTSSSLLLRRQKRSDTESRKKDPSGKDSSSVSAQNQKADSSEPQLISQNQKIKHVLAEGTINIKFTNITFVTPTNKTTILPGISGKIPAGKITGILGPTAW